MKKVHLAVAISFSLLSLGALQADELISLDDPAPAKAGGLESLDDSAGATGSGSPGAAGAVGAAGGDAEVALDVGNEESFTPYTFSRQSGWAFLPIGALILVGLHLLRVPKRKSKRKIDQARRFFRGISGEATNSSIVLPSSTKGEKK